MDPALQWVPVDITALLFGLWLSSALLSYPTSYVRFRKCQGVWILYFVMLTTWFAVSLFWSSSNQYGLEKLTLFFGICGALYLNGILQLSINSELFRAFLVIMTIASAVFSIEALAMADTASFVSLHGAEGDYIGISRVIGLGFLSAFSFALFEKKGSNIAFVLLFVIMALQLSALLVIGARGPLVSVAFALLFLYLFKDFIVLLPRGKVGKGVLVVTVLIASLVGLLILNPGIIENSLTAQRLLYLVEQHGGGASAGERVVRYLWTIEEIAARPMVGFGLGSWPVEYGLGDIKEYPHNLFLEIMFETGLAGLFLLVFPLLYIGFKCLNSPSLLVNHMSKTYFLMMLYELANAMISSDLSGNRTYWLFLGATLVSISISGRESGLNFQRPESR